MQGRAIASTTGRVTLPVKIRAELGIIPGSRIRFELRDTELVIIPELPISAYCAMLTGYDLRHIESKKEPDRTFE